MGIGLPQRTTPSWKVSTMPSSACWPCRTRRSARCCLRRRRPARRAGNDACWYPPGRLPLRRAYRRPYRQPSLVHKEDYLEAIVGIPYVDLVAGPVAPRRSRSTTCRGSISTSCGPWPAASSGTDSRRSLPSSAARAISTPSKGLWFGIPGPGYPADDGDWSEGGSRGISEPVSARQHDLAAAAHQAVRWAHLVDHVDVRLALEGRDLAGPGDDDDLHPFLPGLSTGSVSFPSIQTTHLGAFRDRTNWTLSLPQTPSLLGLLGPPDEVGSRAG